MHLRPNSIVLPRVSIIIDNYHVYYTVMPCTINLCVENENKESDDGSSDGGMEIEDTNKMQTSASDTTVVPKATAAVGMFHDLNTIIFLLRFIYDPYYILCNCSIRSYAVSVCYRIIYSDV